MHIFPCFGTEYTKLSFNFIIYSNRKSFRVLKFFCSSIQIWHKYKTFKLKFSIFTFSSSMRGTSFVWKMTFQIFIKSTFWEPLREKKRVLRRCLLIGYDQNLFNFHLETYFFNLHFKVAHDLMTSFSSYIGFLFLKMQGIYRKIRSYA